MKILKFKKEIENKEKMLLKQQNNIIEKENIIKENIIKINSLKNENELLNEKYNKLLKSTKEKELEILEH